MKIPHTHSVLPWVRVFGVLAESIRRWPRWKNGIRTFEGNEGQGAWYCVWRNDELKDPLAASKLVQTLCQSRGKEEACRDAKRDQKVAEVHLDFMFVGDEGDDRMLAVLVVKERSRGMVMSTVAPRKSSGQWLGRRVMAFIREAGCEVEAVVILSDNELALTKVVDEIGRLRAAIGGHGMVVENSVHSRKSKVFIERTIQSVEGPVRTWRSSLEAKWGVKLDVEHKIWSWLVVIVGWMMLRADVGTDGKTGYERCKGTRARLLGMELGEAVLWKRRREGGGIFLDVKKTTGDYRNWSGEEEDHGRAVAPENTGVGRRRATEDRRRRRRRRRPED